MKPVLCILAVAALSTAAAFAAGDWGLATFGNAWVLVCSAFGAFAGLVAGGLAIATDR